MKRTSKLLATVAAAAFTLAAVSAQAGVVVGPVSVSASIPDLSSNYSVNNLINQTGISATYTSGVTDFDTFVGSTTLTVSPSANSGTGWASTVNNNFPATIDFDFGSVLSVTRMALWNDVDTQSLGNFEIFTSIDASFTSLTSLGSFTGTVHSIGQVAQVFDMTDASTQYLRVSGSPIQYNNGLLNIGEFAFESGTTVTAPETLAILGLGLAVLGYARRKRTH